MEKNQKGDRVSKSFQNKRMKKCPIIRENEVVNMTDSYKILHKGKKATKMPKKKKKRRR